MNHATMALQELTVDLDNLKYLVVGTGFFGSVMAERIAEDKGERVIVIDKREHIGGASFSKVDGETGIEYHKYGSHIFHTAIEKVWQYINRFCTFNSYRHKVLTTYHNKVYRMPINLQTINAFYGLNLTPAEAESFIKSEVDKEQISNPTNLEEKAISLIGKPLYEALIKGYTAKHWGTDPKTLPAEIITRLPVRFNYKSDYFDDPWQGIPIEGYGRLFEKMLAHRNTDIYPNTDFFSIRHLIPKDCCIVYTGRVDQFFDYKHGELGWRTLSFGREVHQVGDFQGTAVMNYAEASLPYTRTHEFKHLHEERNYSKDITLIFREYSKPLTEGDDPYYPMNTAKDREIHRKYQKEIERKENVIFGGRLAGYRYLNMDQTIASALKTYDEKIKPR
jgi:UDP-galactopyranose mutase